MHRDGIERFNQQGDEWQISAYILGDKPMVWFTTETPDYAHIVAILKLAGLSPDWVDASYSFVRFHGEGTIHSPAVWTIAKVSMSGVMELEVEATRLPSQRMA